jgi:hypothetical protein
MLKITRTIVTKSKNKVLTTDKEYESKEEDGKGLAGRSNNISLLIEIIL